jgi:hypothetical protein
MSEVDMNMHQLDSFIDHAAFGFGSCCGDRNWKKQPIKTANTNRSGTSIIISSTAWARKIWAVFGKFSPLQVYSLVLS